MPSITSWLRLEPRARSEDMRISLQARVHDPLWLLARQWQFGEFKGEDAGSPVVARLRAACSRLSRYHPGRLPDGSSAAGLTFDNLSLPLETLVERERIRSGGDASPRLAAEAGLHFLRLLTAYGAGIYRDAYVDHYAFKSPIDEERKSLDSESRRFLNVIARRIPDGALLYKDLSAALHPPDGGPGGLPAEPAIAEADRENVTKVAEAWLEWYEKELFSEPAIDESPWVPERMEYEFAVSAHTADGEVVLVAPEYMEGHLDWYSFTVHPSASLGAKESDVELKEITRTVIPTPVSFRGMPAPRWWEFEDAQIDFGAVEAGPEDLGRLLLMEFALIYGNDWFVMPVEVLVGSICRLRSLVVTDTFGERTLIRPYTQVDRPGSPWRMFCPGLDRRADASSRVEPPDIFFLSPVLASSLQSPPVEEVLFLRDEMANMAWAVERVVESPTGRPLNRFEAYQEQEERRRRAREAAPSEPTVLGAAPIVYRLATSVPDHWIPLVPVQIEKENRSIRLQRGKMLRDRLDEPVETKPRGRILEPGRKLSLFEEAVPRSGARVTRAYQYTRWIDGSTHLWIGRRKGSGRGEGSSGLRFDIVEPV